MTMFRFVPIVLGGIIGFAALTSPVSLQEPTPGLDEAVKKEIAMQLVSSAENSTLDWRAHYSYIEDIGDGRGYTGGIIGFTSGTGDMLDVVRSYGEAAPDNPLATYIPALIAVNGTDSHEGLGPAFEAAWEEAAHDPRFRASQDTVRDAMYFLPAVAQAKSDGLGTLGQFIYYDAVVVHGPGLDPDSFGGIRADAVQRAVPPADGGDERQYLRAFLDARAVVMKRETAHQDLSRIEAQQKFLDEDNLALLPPLSWRMYGDDYEIPRDPLLESATARRWGEYFARPAGR